MSAVWHEKCQKRPDFRERWDAKMGPGQSKAKRARIERVVAKVSDGKQWWERVAEHRQPGERGPGDTIDRMRVQPGFGTWVRECGIPCTARKRSAKYNRTYPYESCSVGEQ